MCLDATEILIAFGLLRSTAQAAPAAPAAESVNVSSDDEEQENRECTICQSPILPNAPVMITRCNHTFHFQCLNPWLKRQSSCPYCRANLEGCEPESRQLFVDAFSIARELNCNPCATPDELCKLLDECATLRQQRNAEAISKLQLPDCEGSWFAMKYRHLRYSVWDRVLPVYMDMMQKLPIALFHQYIAIGGLCKVAGNEGGEAIVSRWMAELTRDASKIMHSGGFWALVGKVGGEDIVTTEGSNGSIRSAILNGPNLSSLPRVCSTMKLVHRIGVVFIYSLLFLAALELLNCLKVTLFR